MRWLERGLAPHAAQAIARGLSIEEDYLRSLWDEQQQGMPFEALRSRVMRAWHRPHPQRDLSEEEVEGIRRLLLSDKLAALLKTVLVHDVTFLAAVLEIYRDAVRLAWSKPFYRKKIIDLAKRWGLGDIADTWLFSAIEQPYTNRGRRDWQIQPEALALSPYVMYMTMEDDRVRPNHFALQGFVARADWEGWVKEVLPPHGWNCRCLIMRVTLAELGEDAVARGGTFPDGIAALERFRAIGGSDAGFPRDRFVREAMSA